MKRTIFIFLFSLLFVSPKSDVMVYICMGPQSECYHKTRECRGIKNCSKEVKKVSLDEAKEKYRRRACGYCYKKRR